MEKRRPITQTTSGVQANCVSLKYKLDYFINNLIIILLNLQQLFVDHSLNRFV